MPKMRSASNSDSALHFGRVKVLGSAGCMYGMHANALLSNMDLDGASRTAASLKNCDQEEAVMECTSFRG